jgi:hypothetical protein
LIANPLINHCLLRLSIPVVLSALAVVPSLTQAQESKQLLESPSQSPAKPFSSEFRRAWLDAKGAVATENQVAVAALCWAVKEQMHDKPFTPWLSDKSIQVDWPLDQRFARFASFDLFSVLPQGITDDHLRRAWLDLYGLPLTEKDKENAALSWIKLQSTLHHCDAD